MEKSNRLDYLDIAKGIGIILVVLAHVYAFNPEILVSRGKLVTWIYSFHMPLFFIISGMLIRYKNKIDLKKTIFSRVKGILVPYLFFSLVSIFIFALLADFEKGVIKELFRVTILGIGIETLWFLPALFFSDIIFTVMKKIVKNDYVIGVIIGILFFVSSFVTAENRMLLRFFARGLVALTFIYIGYMLFDIVQKRNIDNKFLIGILIVQIITSHLNGFVDLNNLVFNNKILYLFNSVLGSYVLIEVCKKIKSKSLIYLGKNSLIIMWLHLDLIFLFREYIGMNIYQYGIGLIATMVIILIEIPVIEIINRYLPFIIGRWYKKKICS